MSVRPEVVAPAVDAALRDAALSLEVDIDNHVADMTDLLYAQIPELSDDPAVVRETSAQCRATMLAFTDLVQRGGEPGDFELPAEVVEYVRSAVHRGVALSTLLRGTRIGHDFVVRDWETRLEAANFPPETLLAVMRASLRYTFGFVDALGQGMANEYDRERERWFRSAQAVRADAIRALIDGTSVDVDAASRELGYELRRHHLGLVLWADPLPGETSALPRLERAATEIARGAGCQHPLMFAPGSNLLWAWAGTASAADPDSVARAARDGVSVAVGESGEGADGFRRTHRDAVDASRVARLGGRRPGSVTRFRSIDLATLLAGDTERAQRFVRGELGPLAQDTDEGARLRVTLKVYLEESESRVATGRRLSVHPNTVANRVQACRELLDRDLGERRVQLEVALALAELLDGAVLDAGDAP